MLKKILAVLALSLLISPLGAGAQREEIDLGSSQPLVEALAQEPPLSQADIDVYLKVLPFLDQLTLNPQKADETAKNLNLSPLRLTLLMVKVPLTMVLASGADPQALGLNTLPHVFHPSEAEMALVRNNLETLNAAAEAAAKALVDIAPGATARP